MASICAVGASIFEHGRLASEWYSLVDPDDYFDPINVSIHGIDESTVLGAPGYQDVADTIERLLFGATVVTHTHLDRMAMHQAAHRWAIEARCAWLDSARGARRTWSECARSGYGAGGPLPRSSIC